LTRPFVMDIAFDIMSRLAVTALLFTLGLGIVAAILFAVHWLITLPMRRAERARLFLDVIETALKSGRPIEEALISVSQSRDLSLGVRFFMLTAWMERHLRLEEALARVPAFLPPQITAMLRAGQKIGDLRKVLPACRQLLKDGVSQTRAALSYLVILTLVITPVGIAVFWVLEMMVIPKFVEITGSLGGDPRPAAFYHGHQGAIILVQTCVVLLLWLLAIIYIAGPRLVRWLPILERVHYWLPWRRKRMQRDFSTLLAILLDSGVSEPEAITLAAGCAANKVIGRRAARAIETLKQGRNLAQAVQMMDDSGEFAWRLANAFHGSAGFLPALAGWHESLDAKAFQQEQAAAHGVTTALVLWSGLFVGAVVISVFMFLISLIDAGVLW
jgi:type II secretory pathway component PulF